MGFCPAYFGVLQNVYSALNVSVHDLAAPVFDGVGLAGFKSRANGFFIGLCCSLPSCHILFHFLFFLSQSKSKVVFIKKIYKEHQNILTAVHDQD